ncbi:MAG: hypothetical protein J5518_07795 [Lachnospiraceae bacterium]|nr:hypothetical protein [Lachnospiraceae bacterium]
MKNKLLPVILLALLFLSGCGAAADLEDTESTIYIREDGSIESLIVEPFPEDVYDASELPDMIREMTETYNDEHTGTVKLISSRVTDGQAFVKLTYESAEDYAAFNRTDFFYGTVAEGIEKGYTKKTTLKNAYGSNIVSGAAIADMSSYHMVVVREPVQVRTYEAILYLSPNLELIDEKTARVSSETDSDAILILK